MVKDCYGNKPPFWVFCILFGLVMGVGSILVFTIIFSLPINTTKQDTTKQDIPHCIFPIKTQVICAGDTTPRCLACMESQGQMSCYKFHPYHCKTW